MSANIRPDKYAELQALGKSTAESLAEMVAALECDYERLEELREKYEPVHRTPVEDFDASESEELTNLQAAAGDCESREEAEERIREDPLSVEVRSGWYSPGEDESNCPQEFMILLGTGGPATRIVGELQDCEPYRAWIETQDWFLPWTEYTGGAISQADLLAYCRCFYFGEG